MDETVKKTFHWGDYVMFLSCLGISIGIGLYFALSGGKQRTNSEYLMGDRAMKVIPVALSMLVSFLSSINILGIPVEIYMYGTQFMMHIFAAMIGIAAGAFLWVPLFYPLKITSLFEYYERRFKSKFVQKYASAISLFNYLVFNGIVLYAPCVALEAVTPLPVWLSLVLCGVTTIIYTVLGGMKAVIWSDCFQAFVIFGGVLAILIQGTIEVGGPSEVWRVNQEWDRIHFFDFDPDPTKRLSFWSVVVMNSLLWTCIACNQASVQRFCALPTESKAKTAVLLNMPGFVVSGLMTSFMGVVAFAYYAKKGCDPIQGGIISNPNQIIPQFVMDVLYYPGVPGLFVACLFSASLGAVSSALAAMAAMIYEDFLKERLSHLDATKQTLITKCCSTILGILSVGCAFLVGEIGGTLIQIAYSVLGATAGPVIGVLFAGACLPNAGPVGVTIGGAIGLVMSYWLSLGAAFSHVYAPPLPSPTHMCGVIANITLNDTTTNTISYSEIDGGNTTIKDFQNATSLVPSLSGLQKFYSLSYMWYPFIGIFSVMIIGGLSGLIPGLKQTGKVPKKYLFKFAQSKYYCCQSNVCEDDEDEDEYKKRDIKLDENINDTVQEPFIEKDKDAMKDVL